MIQNYFRGLIGLLKGWAGSQGRGAYYDTLSLGQGQVQSSHELEDEDRPEALSLDPYIFSGIRARDISYLWISAAGIGDKLNNESYSPPQIDYPPFTNEYNQEQLDFVRWNFDEGMTNNGMSRIIGECQASFIEYGRSIIEVDWKYDNTKYKKKLVFGDLLVRDPQKFVINPKGLKPGIYLKQTIYADTVSPKDRVPDKKFMIVSNNQLFGNAYGISEVLLLDDIQNYLQNTLDYYAKGLERNGVGALIGKYAKALSGKGRESDRNTFYQEIRKLRSDTLTIMCEENKIEELSTDIADTAFADFIKTCISTISLVLTGSPTTLIETEHGTYGAEESGTAREKSLLEQRDAAMISDAFNFQLIPWLIDFNFSGVTSYPWMFLIQPELIQPTISESQKELIEVQNDSSDNEDIGKAGVGEDNEKSPQDEFLRLFAEGTNGNFSDEDVKKKLESGDKFPDFPSKTPAPEIWSQVAGRAKEYLADMPVYISRTFEKLPESEKRDAFTIRRSNRQVDQVAIIQALKDAIVDTIEITNEAEAWPVYLKKAKAIMRGMNSLFTPAELIPSFRIARQRAYNEAVLKLDESPDGDKIYGLMYKTMRDGDVRMSHKALDGFLRPANDKVWMRLRPPIDWECRCQLELITMEQHLSNPDKYSYTRETPKIPRGFR